MITFGPHNPIPRETCSYIPQLSAARLDYRSIRYCTYLLDERPLSERGRRS